MTPTRRQLVAAGLGVLALAACGRKTAPVAPERRAPAPVADLGGLVRESSIELSWVNTRRRVDGSRLPDLAVVRVFRTEDAGGGEPRAALLDDGRVAGYAEIATIRLVAPAPAQVDGDRVTYLDRRELRPGRRYTYVVVLGDSQGRLSRPSGRRSVTFAVAPGVPTALAATAGEGEVRLAWQPPARLLDGSPVDTALRFEIFRGVPDAPLGALRTVDEPRLTDPGLENDRPYAYEVRALRIVDDTRVYGPPSTRVVATPRDATPPSPPAGLVAIPAVGTVRLSWTGSPEPDVAGYIVYRTDARGQFVRVGATRVPATTFADQGVPPGVYRYAVTAYDSAAMPNESPRSNEATVTVP